MDTTLITYDQLSVDAAMNMVKDPTAGGSAIFVGTTRDSFDGKTVVKLEYEAYESMALKEMRSLCTKARERWPVVKLAVIHRLGVVPVGEASVICAASAAHRAEAIEACKFLIDELKACVPIWKKEIYTDGSTWKSNAPVNDNKAMS